MRSLREPFPADPSGIPSQPDPATCPAPSQFSGKSPSRRIRGGGKGPALPCPTQTGKNSGMGIFRDLGNGAQGMRDVRDSGSRRDRECRNSRGSGGTPGDSCPADDPAKISAKFSFQDPWEPGGAGGSTREFGTPSSRSFQVFPEEFHGSQACPVKFQEAAVF